MTLALAALAASAAAPPPVRMKATLPGVATTSPYEYYSGFLDAGTPPSGRGKMYFHYICAMSPSWETQPVTLWYNGGPGAPAFVWMHPRHEGQVWQPLTGWLGHAHPFDFDSEYLPAPGIQQYQCGTPPVLSMTALDTALDVFDAAQKLGGMKALRAKSLALTEAFIDSVEARVPGAAIATPREAALRGSQVSFSLPKGVDGYAVMQALIAQGVIGDFRAGTPELLRFGFAPLYNGFADVARAVDVLAGIVASVSWNAPQFTSRAKVT